MRLYPFPVQERWYIHTDPREREPGVTCFSKDGGLQLVVMINAASVNELPPLVEQGKVLLEREKRTLYAGTMTGGVV